MRLHVKIPAPRTVGGQPSTVESRIELLTPGGPSGLDAVRFQVADLKRFEVDAREDKGRVAVTLERSMLIGSSVSRVRVEIDAPAAQEAFFKGRYRLSVNAASQKSPFTADGPVVCSSD